MIHDNADYQVINAAFPRIGKNLELAWGNADFNRLIDELQHGTRGGQRRGFPASVLFALTNLAQAHNKEFAHLAPPKSAMWRNDSTL